MSVLDSRSLIKEVDKHNYLSHVLEAPQQLESGFELGAAVTVPAVLMQAKQVVIVASGEMAPVAHAVCALASASARVPIVVVDDYILPKWVGSDTLVIVVDYYGSSDLAASVFRDAAAAKARLLSLSVGGELAREARRVRSLHVALRYGALARVAFCYTLAVLTAIAKKLDLIDIKSSTITETAVLVRSLYENISPDVLQYQNNAKQLAEKIISRPTIIVGSGPLWPIARKWGVCIGATGKAPVTVVSLADFNATIINGLSAAKLNQAPCVIMLQSKHDHQRNKLTQTLVYQVAQANKLIYEQIFMHPSGSLFGEIALSAVLGEMVGFYVALGRQTDPSLTESSDFIFDELSGVEP